MRIARQRAKGKGHGVNLIAVFVFCPMLFALCFLPCFAGEKTSIQSDSLVYEEKTFTHTARGHVRIDKGSSKIEAEEIQYNEKTSDTVAEGNVIYEDNLIRIKAKRAVLNLDAKTGTFYNAEVFSKKDNYHITGLEIEKTGEKEYKLKNASFTTCDAPLPAWCFRGKQVDLVVGDGLRARNITFNIKGQPVAYFPYFSAPLERKTGLLTPAVGYVTGKGIHYGQELFLVLSDNRDATLVFDGYSKRGIGQGLEYRFVETDGARGDFRVYHLKDTTLKENFWDATGVYENRESNRRIDTFLNLNYISSRDFYNEYYPYLITKMKGYIDSASYLNLINSRFFESDGEISLKFDNSRLYLRAQYLIDLKPGIDESTFPQRLPEVGYTVNPARLGPVTFSLSSSISNFWREKDVTGQRLDIFPRVAHSFGNDITIMQSLGLRETAYSLSRSDGFDSTPHRESFDYTITALTRLIKGYGSFTHILEPSLNFAYIPHAKSDLPLFDSTELFTKTAKIELSLNNRFIDSKGEFLTLRVSQAHDSYQADSPFLPLKLDVVLQRPLVLRSETSYNVRTGKFEIVNSDVGIRIYDKGNLSVGERYDRSLDTMFYIVGLSYTPLKSITAGGAFWQDAKNGGIKDIIASLKYQQQCWGVTAVITKQQSVYSYTLLFNLLGLGTVKL